MGRYTQFLTESNITYAIEHIDNAYGQNDYRIYARKGSAVVGTLDFSEYHGEISVKMVDVPEEYRRQGIGKELVRTLQKEYPDTEINLGMTTELGTKLHNSLKDELYVNKDKERKKNELIELHLTEKEMKKEFDALYDMFGNDEAKNNEIKEKIMSLNDKYTEVTDKIYDLENELQ